MKRPTADPYVISRAKSGRWSWWCNRIYCDAYQTDLPTEAVAMAGAYRHQRRAHASPTVPALPEPARQEARIGVCRICRCTETRPCPDGCRWANAFRDLCTAYADHLPRREPPR